MKKVSRANIILLLVCIFLRQCVSQAVVQNYIRIRPAVMSLNENRDRRAVKITCRQTPTSSSGRVLSLAILRKPLLVGRGTSQESKLVEKRTDGRADTLPNPRKYTASGDTTTLTLTIPVATCNDARYTYICRMTLTNRQQKSISDTIKTELTPPTILLLAKPAKRQYSKKDTLTLT